MPCRERKGDHTTVISAKSLPACLFVLFFFLSVGSAVTFVRYLKSGGGLNNRK